MGERWRCSRVRPSEWIEIVYFAVLAAAAVARPLTARRRGFVVATGAAMSAAVVWLARNGTVLQRDWAPTMVILIGYYVPVGLVGEPTMRVENWLTAWDRRLLGDPTARFVHWPGPLLAICELAYGGTFVLIPLGSALLLAAGHGDRVDTYWTMVVAAEFGSFAPLAIWQTRPPWLVERAADLPDPLVHGLTARMVQRFTIRANTFPSGHVAGSLAIALAVPGQMPLAGGLLMLVSLGIAVGCILGSYHYVIDVIACVALALTIWMIVGV